jgi:hypothetical protein
MARNTKSGSTMSETPRTDTLERELIPISNGEAPCILVNHARTLERENTRLRNALERFIEAARAALA